MDCLNMYVLIVLFESDIYCTKKSANYNDCSTCLWKSVTLVNLIFYLVED